MPENKSETNDETVEPRKSATNQETGGNVEDTSNNSKMKHHVQQEVSQKETIGTRTCS